MNHLQPGRDGNRWEHFILGAILFLFMVYAGVFIWRTSFIIGSERYFSLFDDAMISMRYARNLASGLGLVMNPGERVEGITNPLWALYMAAVHLLPVSMPKISLIIQITGIILLAGVILLVWRLARFISCGDLRAAIAATVFTAFYLPLINWTLQGMETGLQAFMVLILTIGIIRGIRDGSVPVWVFVFAGIGTLVRVDMTAPYLIVWLFTVWALPGERKRNIFLGAAVLVLFLGGQTLARFLYYGDPLPNTYYLKMTGYPVILRITRGVFVTVMFIWRMNPLFFLLPFVMLLFARSRARLLLALMVLGQLAYSIYVGGDAWEDWGGANRYTAFVMPLFFVLLTDALARVSDFIGERPRSGKSQCRRANRVPLALHRACVARILRAVQQSGVFQRPRPVSPRPTPARRQQPHHG